MVSVCLQGLLLLGCIVLDRLIRVRGSTLTARVLAPWLPQVTETGLDGPSIMRER